MQTLYNIILSNITEIMEEKGITQKQLTDHLKISKSAYTDWKSGKNKSFMKHLDKIAVFLNVSVEELISVEKKEQATPTEQPVDEIDKEILELTADMTEEEKNSVLGYAARLVAKHKKED